MPLDLFDKSILHAVDEHARKLEDRLRADVVFYHGRIAPGYFRTFRDFIEKVKAETNRTDKAIAAIFAYSWWLSRNSRANGYGTA